ncbi:MAG: hypothetical protein ABFD89_13450 [Bryobacteraceae bacterium]
MSVRYLVLVARMLLAGVSTPHGPAAAVFRFVTSAIEIGLVAFAAWGIWNAIGLLRGRVWARRSVLVFATALLVLETLGGAGTFQGIRNNPMPYIFARAMLPHFLMGAFGVCWLVWLNTRQMRTRLAPSVR